MRRSAMTCAKFALALPPLLLAAGCDGPQDGPPPIPSPSTVAAPAPTPTITPPPLDTAALDERENPDRVLRYYGAALSAGDWQAASRAWGSDSGVSGITLQAAYGAKGRVTLLPGKGSAMRPAVRFTMKPR